MEARSGVSPALASELLGPLPPIHVVGSTQSGILEQALEPNATMPITATRAHTFFMPSNPTVIETPPSPAGRAWGAAESIYRAAVGLPSETAIKSMKCCNNLA
jgi:hypothetical protein